MDVIISASGDALVVQFVPFDVCGCVVGALQNAVPVYVVTATTFQSSCQRRTHKGTTRERNEIANYSPAASCRRGLCYCRGTVFAAAVLVGCSDGNN